MASSPDSPAAPRRLVFFGTAELAVASLSALACLPAWNIVAVVTQPDRPKGRALRPQPSPVKVRAVELGLPVWQPERCRAPDFLERLRAAAPDLIVVAAYGQLLPPALLELPPHGCLNVHASLLPKYRGAAPIQAALLQGEAETGVTLMRMDAGLDTGPVVAQERTPVAPGEDAARLHDRLAELGATLLVRSLPAYLEGRLTPQPQPVEGVSYAGKITREDGRLDWSLPAETLGRKLRAFTPWPGVFTHLPGPGKPVLLKIGRAELVAESTGRPGEVLCADRAGIVIACGQGALRVTELQREGGRRLTAAEFLQGHPLPAGLVLGP